MGTPNIPEAMSAEEMLGMQKATAEAQLALEDKRMEHMLDVEQKRLSMEEAEKARLKQQSIAEEAALANMQMDLTSEISSQEEEDDEDKGLMSGFGASLLQGLSSQGRRPS